CTSRHATVWKRITMIVRYGGRWQEGLKVCWGRMPSSRIILREGPATGRAWHYTDAWLDMNALQSSHGSRETDPWNWIMEDLAKSPQKPTLDMEPCYEDHPVNPWDGKWTREGRGYFNAYDVRARIYRGGFAGGRG